MTVRIGASGLHKIGLEKPRYFVQGDNAEAELRKIFSEMGLQETAEKGTPPKGCFSFLTGEFRDISAFAAMTPADGGDPMYYDALAFDEVDSVDNLLQEIAANL